MSDTAASPRDAPQPITEDRSSTLETDTYALAAPPAPSEASSGNLNPVSPTPAGTSAAIELPLSATVASPPAHAAGSDERRSSPPDSDDRAPAQSIRFDSLEGQIPDEQLGKLRAFVSHHALGIQRLRLAEANLSNLGGQLNEVKEHATSLTRRIDRAMSDNARFLLESDAQLSELGRIFDRPRTAITANSGVRPGTIPDPASAYDRGARSAASESDDGLYAPEPAKADDSASRSGPARAHPAIESLARVALSSSSRASLPAQRPHETSDQYDARYEANIRNIDRTEESWSRAYPGVNLARPATVPNNPSGPTNLPRDVRFERPGPPGESSLQRPFGNIPTTATAARSPYESVSRPPGLNPYAGIPVPPIGISAYRVTQGPVTNGLWNHDHYHYVVLLGKITQLIDHKVGAHIDVPPGLKHPKLSEPPKYSGSHSHDDFVDWLGTFLNWLRGHYICGPATDAIRVNYLGLYIDGVASDWYHTEIDNPAKRYDNPLSFADCVCLMHKRFVRTATANDAAIKYNAVRYLASEGVEGLYYRLDTAAERMIERPNDYEFRRRLFNLLPRWLHDKLKDRNIIPEYASLEDLRENARQLEENSLRHYEGVGDSAATTPSRERALPARVTKPPRSSEALRASAVRAASNPAAVPPTAASPRPNTRVGAQNARAPRDTSTMLCYSCGKMGHIASEPKCENYDASKARLHAQREVEEVDGNPEVREDHENSHYDHHNPDDEDIDERSPLWGGSQYESNYASGEDQEELSEDNARMASMHVRMAAMRIEQDYGDHDLELFEADCGQSEDEEMPALISCSESDEELERTPRTDGPTLRSDNPSTASMVDWAPQLSSILRAANGHRTVMDLSDGFRRISINAIPRYVDDPTVTATTRSPLSVTIGDRGVPEYREHIPNPDTIRIVNHTVWIDVQERTLDFDAPDRLDHYNRALSSIVPCYICDGVCRPSVYQILASVITSNGSPTYMTLYACNLPRRLASPIMRQFSPDLGEEDQYADSHGDYSEESMYAMRVTYSSNIRRPATSDGVRPRHNPETITAVVTINGHKALTLFDSGSTTDSITPEFGFVSRTRQFKLDDQVTLQLGCVGSRSKISYGARAPVAVFGISEDMYFDVVNIDRYDAILGTPFLRKHGVCIDFKKGGIVIDGQFYKTFSVGEEIAYIAKRGEARDPKLKERSRPRETAPIRQRSKAPGGDNPRQE